jgi:hypothetical protein
MSEDDDKTYDLPTPDMNVFGANEADRTTTPSAAGGATDHAHDGSGHEGGGGGTMRFQDASTATPRPPTLAEQRARIAAEEEVAADAEARSAKAASRRRVMIGGGVTVGVVALVGAWYLLASPDTVTAQCTVAAGAQTDTVVNDQYCDDAYVTSHGGHISNGFIFMPLVGGGYTQYHYYYGGTGTVGQRATGGSFTEPSNATVKTKSGSTIKRGGFGITGRSGGSSGGGGSDEGGTHGKSGGS